MLLITVDTLRADRLHCYGYERETSPNLDALAAEGILFERAYSHAPFTAPSHASLLTSLHTQTHGVLAWGEKLADGTRTYPAYFSTAGYRTGAFYNHPGLIPSEITRDFDHVQLRAFGPADETVASFLDWVDDGDEPFASWVHLWDVHRPYGYRDWSQDWFVDNVPEEMRPDRLELPFEERRYAPDGDVRIGRTEQYYNLNARKRAEAKPTSDGGRVLTDADYAYIGDRYDGGINYADDGLGLLFDGLRERGLLDETVVVVTSDHGETLTERDGCYFTHDPYLYDETLRIPLIVRLPGAQHAGVRVSELVRGVDVLPSLFEASDVAIPEGAGLQGRSVLALARGEDDGPSRVLFAQTQTRNAKERDELIPEEEHGPDNWLEYREAVVAGDLKLIHDVELGAFELFDLADDPDETNDLADDPEYADRPRPAGVRPGRTQARAAAGRGTPAPRRPRSTRASSSTPATSATTEKRRPTRHGAASRGTIRRPASTRLPRLTLSDVLPRALALLRRSPRRPLHGPVAARGPLRRQHAEGTPRGPPTSSSAASST